MSIITKDSFNTTEGLTPYQTVGPYFSIGLEPLYRDSLYPDRQHLSRLAITGAVIDGKGKPVPDAMIEIWQANEVGEYSNKSAGFGRVPTDEYGRYSFTTVKPGSVKDPNGIVHAPHLLVTVFMRGLLVRLNTRIYFPDEDIANEVDPIFGMVPTDRRRTLLAEKDDETRYRFNIVLQGADETVFFSY